MTKYYSLKSGRGIYSYTFTLYLLVLHVFMNAVTGMRVPTLVLVRVDTRTHMHTTHECNVALKLYCIHIISQSSLSAINTKAK